MGGYYSLLIFQKHNTHPKHEYFSYVITIKSSTQWYTTTLLLWHELNILWLNIGNDIRFPNELVNVNRLNTINTLVTLVETKSKGQWQSEPTRSKIA